MGGKRLSFALASLGLLAMLLAGPPHPALAHENHQQERVEAIEPAEGASASSAMPRVMADHRKGMERSADADRSWPSKLVHWLGRVHPFAVHFPIALVPVSLFALILARRRGDPAGIVRGLIILAGLSAVIAAALGWLDGGFLVTDRNPIKLWHRWIGTGLGVAGAVLALWAWRRGSSVPGRPMIGALGLLTAALLIQGWLGGALVHGIRHMNW